MTTDQPGAWRKALAAAAKAKRTQRGRHRRRDVTTVNAPGMVRLAPAKPTTTQEENR